MAAVATTLLSLLLVNSLLYVMLMHLLYTVMLTGMGYRVGTLPRFAQRWAPNASLAQQQQQQQGRG